MVSARIRRDLAISRKAGVPPSDFTFINRTRFVILVVCTLCLSIAQSNVLTLNFTIICMASDPLNISDYNTTGNIFEDMNGTYYETSPSLLTDYLYDMANRPYTYTANQKNLLFSFVAIGAIVAVYPCMWLMQKFGSRSIVTIFGFFSALCTALIPLCAYLGFYWILIMRFLQGMGLATGFTLIGIVTLQWSMKKQSAFFIAVLTCFFQIGPIFTMPVAGALCTSSLGWSSVYYLHAIVTCVLFSLFLYFYREFPHRHKMVSDKELDRIKRLKGDTTKKDPVPIKAILTSPAILCCWVSAVGNFIGIQVTMQFSPTYLNKVMGFPIEQTGLFSAIPQIVTFFLKIAAGYAADKAQCCSTVVSVKIFNCLAIGGMGLAFFALAVIPTDMPYVGLAMLIFCCTIVGFNCGAFFRSSAIVAAQHNHFVMGVNSFINCLCSLLAPVVVNIFVRDDTWDEWWYVWMVHGILLTVTNIVFCIFGKGEAAEWTKTPAPVMTVKPPTSNGNGTHNNGQEQRTSVAVQTALNLENCLTCKVHDSEPSNREFNAWSGMDRQVDFEPATGRRTPPSSPPSPPRASRRACCSSQSPPLAPRRVNGKIIIPISGERF